MEKSNIRWGLTSVCFILVLLLGVSAVLAPDMTKSTIDGLFNYTIFNLGSGFLWYILFGTGVLIWLAFSKYGNIYLGGNKPQFNRFQLFAMALSAGMGASTMYWGFIEAVYYYSDPQFGIVDNAMKLEYATAYNMFHWGPAGWVSYLMCAVPFMVAFYIKKDRKVSLSGVISTLFEKEVHPLLEKTLNLLFIVTSLAATALTLGLAIPMISSVVSLLTGLEDTLMLGVSIIVALSFVFAMSSYVGLEKGMARLSSGTVYICAGMIIAIFLFGNTSLMINNTTNAVGIVLSDYIRMSLNTDAFGDTGFPQYWTVFFFANWISYAPGMGIFITKIAKGHKLKDVILILIGAGFLGTTLIFGICSTFTLDLMNNGVVDAVGLIEAGRASELVIQVLYQTPIPTVMILVYLITMVLFTVTTLDGTSFSLASVTTQKVKEDGSVSPMFRLFWCLLLGVIPTIFLIIQADLNILKSFPVLILVPMIPIFTVVLTKSTNVIKKEFGNMTIAEIENSTSQSENTNLIDTIEIKEETEETLETEKALDETESNI